MIAFLVWALMLLIVLYVVKLIVDQLPLPDNIKVVALLIVGLIFLLLLLNRVGVAIPGF